MYRIRKQYIKAFSQSLAEGINELGENYQAVQLLSELKKDYVDELRPEIVSVRLYQTERACYLEMTIDELKEKGISPSKCDTPVPDGVDPTEYRIHRYVADHYLDLCTDDYKISEPLAEKAFRFLDDLSDYEKAQFQLFTDDGYAKFEEEDYLSATEAIDPMEPGEYIPGEISLSGESLKDLDGYESDYDPDFPMTPMATIRIEEELTELLLDQNDTHVGTGQPVVQGNLPSFIGIRSAISEEQRLTTISIPNEQIKTIRIKTSDYPSVDSNLPDKYYFFIELKTGDIIHVEGRSGEDTSFPPEYWYYKHRIRVE